MKLRAPLLLLLLACGCATGPGPVAQESARVRGEQTLLDLARENGLGYGEIVAANPGIDPWVPGDGNQIVLPSVHIPPPAPDEGIVINIADQRLYLFQGEGPPISYPIGIGRPGWLTPIGTTTIVKLSEAPTWFPTESAKREDPTLTGPVLPGPDNPLGTHAIYLGWPRFLIHGTNEPLGVGRRVSRGCIRLYPEDIVRLFERVEVGMSVRVVNASIKTGWMRDELYLEAHPPLIQESEEVPVVPREISSTLKGKIREIAGDAEGRLDWPVIEETLYERRGVPVRVTLRAVN